MDRRGSKSTDAPKASKAVPGAGSSNSRILALRFIAWAIEAVQDVPQDVSLDESDFESDPSTTVAKALTVELWNRAGAFASSVAVAMTPPSGVGKARGSLSTGSCPTASRPSRGGSTRRPHRRPGGGHLNRTSVYAAVPRRARRDVRGKEATDHVIDIIAAGMGCGARDVEAAARRALRRHCDALSGQSLRRAVQLTLRSAEEAMEGSDRPNRVGVQVQDGGCHRGRGV